MMSNDGARVTRMQTTYMTENDPQAFLDFPEPELPPRGRAVCPRCGGHGGWNLRLNASPLPAGVDDTPENRHRYAHFQAACMNCNGWGHVPGEQAEHIHQWKTTCWSGSERTDECETCGQRWNLDTSG